MSLHVLDPLVYYFLPGMQPSAHWRAQPRTEQSGCDRSLSCIHVYLSIGTELSNYTQLGVHVADGYRGKGWNLPSMRMEKQGRRAHGECSVYLANSASKTGWWVLGAFHFLLPCPTDLETAQPSQQGSEGTMRVCEQGARELGFKLQASEALEVRYWYVWAPMGSEGNSHTCIIL